jgi:outer membrane lipoprotein-sorting protein
MSLRLPRVASVVLAGLALVSIPAGLSAQQLPPAPPLKPLPAVVPMPPLPPLPKEGTLAAVAAPQAAQAPQTNSTANFFQKLVQPKPEAKSTIALNNTQRQALERVNAYYNSITTLIGNFVQVGPDRSRIEGDFYLQKPGKVRFDYDPPSPVELISDGSSVIVRDRKLATQDLYPLSQTPLRFLLADKLDLLRDTNVIGVYQDDLFINVVIEEKHPLVGTHKLMLMFGAKDSELKQWTITDPQGYDTTIAIFNVDLKQKPDPSLFKIDYTLRRD